MRSIFQEYQFQNLQQFILQMIGSKIYGAIYPEAVDLQTLSMLIVGVGGIGCELLKVLSKAPLKQIHIIDMDTIELTNLNRQFLFKKQHKGKSKALTAKQTLTKINPNLNIVAHHSNIRQMPIHFFQQFHFIVLALDNIDARNYINKIGVRLGIPLIDAGTSGFLGNVHIIIPNETQCYACEPKQTSKKSFPVCTIRMRPEKPIHCIHWAKMLFEVFFSGEQIDNDMKDLETFGKQGKQNEILFELFHKQIQNIKEAKVESDQPLSQEYVAKLKPIDPNFLNEGSVSTLEHFEKFDDKLTIQENVGIAKKAFSILIEQKKNDGSVVFEKDDDNIIHFISSMANLRMSCFAIEIQSFNEVKNVAGNIIPAIASTNSIVSGLEVLSMMYKWIKQDECLKSQYVQNQKNKVQPVPIEKAKKTCEVCSNQPVIIEANFQSYYFSDLIDYLKKNLFDLEEFSLNRGEKELYHSDYPNKILMNKKISEIDNSKYEMDLFLSDETNFSKRCNIWLINNPQIVSPVYKNENKLNEKKEVREEEKKDENRQNDDSDDVVVMGEKQEENDIELIEVKKAENGEDQMKKKIKEV